MCALTFTDDFAAGATYFGITDLERFEPGTAHKFERDVQPHARRPVSRGGRGLPRAQPDPLRRADLDPDARAPGRRRRGRPARAVGADRRARSTSVGSRTPTCSSRARGTASARPRTSSPRSRPSSPSTRRSWASSPATRSRQLDVRPPRLTRRRPSPVDREYDSRAMQSFVIEGGRPLSGTVRAAGNKNAALPVLAASILASGEVRLSNVPRIRDVETMVELLADLGADVEWTGPNEVRVDGTGGREDEPRPGARAGDPRVVPARRAAALALRARHRPASGRRRHRAAAPRHARPRASPRSARSSS